ncbi:HD-GYP domain-containing protein [Halobacillus seohaensis]|uniref:HD-GYP domain-containing protein n=1 Tax=Halobacillus seohaensis TaxID=447421 RepID=A0ABW2EN40_9BACI
MEDFKRFEKQILLNYIIGSLIAVFGVGSTFIFHTLTLTLSEVFYLLAIMVLSGIVMLICEFLVYQKHIQPIKLIFHKEKPSRGELEKAYIRLHRFPLLTIKRILGPHLFGLAIPASILSIVGITNGWIGLPTYYIALAWAGSILIAVMHALIEFFLTYRSIQFLLRKFLGKARAFQHVLSLEDKYAVSLKSKLLISSLFTAVFPLLLFILALQIRFSENATSGIQNYWNWASLIVGVILVMALLGTLLLYKSIEEPIDQLLTNFDKVREGHFHSIENIYSDEFANLVTGFNHMVSSIKARDEKNQKLLESFFTVFAATLDARDPYTAGHSKRVAEYSVRIARRANFSNEEVDLIRKSALLHDIGKIGVRDDVLLKDGKLTEEEFVQIKQHPVIGYSILKQVQLPEELIPVLSGVRHHHERYDGKGYPDQLAGDEIPVFGRLMAVADAYDAMTSDRPYREGMSDQRALAIIESGKGNQWDRYFADLFLEEMDYAKIQKTI